jgi:hypothetical protein
LIGGMNLPAYSLQSKIRGNVDHAGHLLLLRPSNHIGLFTLENCMISQNNKLPVAQTTPKAVVGMEVVKVVLLNWPLIASLRKEDWLLIGHIRTTHSKESILNVNSTQSSHHRLLNSKDTLSCQLTTTKLF